MAARKKHTEAADIPVIGEVDDWEADVVRALLEVPVGGSCTFYIDSAGGSVFGALAVLTLLRHRKINATALVLGECSSATLLLFAAAQRRLVTPHGVFFFHRMRWQSEKRVGAQEAFRWAKHFEELEHDIDILQVQLFGKAEEQIRAWIEGGHYITGRDIVAAGLAELFDLA